MNNGNGSDYHPPDPVRTRELFATLRPAYEKALLEISGTVRALLEQHGLTPTIKTRLKRFDDYYEKLLRSARKKKRAPVITDLLGLRIICPFLEDVVRVERLLADRFEVVETVRKAAGHSFREFGYDSVHLLVRMENTGIETPLPHTRRVCEIQLRTILQEAWAEVEHELVYKSRLAWPNESIRRKLAALNATLTLSDLTFQEIRDYQKEVMALGHKRRSALEGAISLPVLDNPDISSETLAPSASRLSASHSSPLEKTMLEALEAHSQHQFERAIELYSQILGMRLSRKIRSLIYNHRGMAYFSINRNTEALHDFTEAIGYDRENLRAHCNRGLIRRLAKRLNPSLEDYDRALAIDPSFIDAWLGRAQTWLAMRLPDRALADCEKALEINPQYAAASGLMKKVRREFFHT